MAGKFVQGNWLLPNNVNANKQSNYSFDFNGTNQYITLGSISNINTDFTVSGWINTTNLTTSNGAFRGWFSSGTNFSSANEFAINISTLSSYGGVGFINVWEGNSMIIAGTSSVADGNWHHVVLTKTSTELKLYVDGSLQNTVSNSSTWTWNNVHVGIGNSNQTFGTQGLFDGKIDELSVFSRALSLAEVNSLYNSGTPGNPFDLSGDPIAYYKLGETAIGQAPGGTWNWQVPNHAQSQQAIQATNANNFTQLVTPITQLGNTHTLSIWINSNGSTSIPVGQFFVQGNISSYYNPYTNSADGVYITTDSANGQSLPLSSIIYRSNNNQLTASIGQLDDNNWHNLIIVRTPTAVKAYIDGGSELTLSGATLTASDTYLLRFLTGIYSAQGAAWMGIVSNPAIWLSDRSSEVANIYNSGEPQSVYTTAPDYWWKLDNSTQVSTVPPTTGTTPIINYKTISSSTLTTFNSKTAVINQGYGFSAGVSMLFDNQINLGTQSTVSYWLLSAPFETGKPKFNTHGGGVNIFSNFSDQVGVGTYGGAYILKGPSNNVITLEVYNSTSSSEKATLTFSQANNPTEYAKIFDLNYHNWMFVRNGSNVSFYFDNVLIDSSSSLNATNNTVLKRFSGTMGTAASPTANWGGNKFSNGVEIDEISLFNKALSSSERTTLYNSGNAGNISSLSPSIWYNGDSVDFTNSKMLDLSGGSNNASLIGTSTGSSNTGLLTNFQQFLIYKEGAFAGGSAGNAGLALVNTDLGLNNPLYSQFSNSFDTTTYIDTNFAIPNWTKYAYSIWFKFNGSTISSYDHLIGNLSSGANADGRAIIGFKGTNLYLNMGDGTNYWYSDNQSATPLLDGNWHHIVLNVYETGQDVYVDGSLLRTYTYTGSVTTGTPATANNYINKGGSASSNNGVDSSVDEHAVFSRLLTTAEILSIYNNGKPNDISALSPSYWWRLGDSSYTNSSNYYVFPNKIANASDGIGLSLIHI